MKAAWLALAVFCACKKDNGTATRATPGSGSGSATVVVAAGDAAVAPGADAGVTADVVDLLHGVRTTIRVSSQVRNKAILPQHIADGSMQTAWNSKTGELAGAWIDVTSEDAQIRELRLTVGHTGKGKKGEDYFTMNPRITKVRVLVDGKPEQQVALDPEKRDLQTIAVAGGSHVRIVIADVKPGTKKSWREAAVSELQVWGAPPAGWVKPPSPLDPIVLVGEDVPVKDPNDPCASIEEERAAREESNRLEIEGCQRLPDEESREHCGVDQPGLPTCTHDEVSVDKIAEPWVSAIETCKTQDEIYGPTVCSVDVKTKTGSAGFEAESDRASDDVTIQEAVMADVIPGVPAELVFRYQLGSNKDTLQLVVCRAAPTVACSAPLPLAGEDWQTDVTFKDGQAVLFMTSGTPPADAVGTKPLVFQ